MRMSGAVAALGAALIALAVGAAPSTLAAAPWLAVPLVAAGGAQALVAVLALRGAPLDGRPRMPRAAALVPLALPTVAWIGALMAAPAAATLLPLGPMLAETALALAAAVLLAGHRRARPAEPRPLPALLSLTASAAVVAVIATAALAGTEAGRFAVPHGEHGAHSDTSRDDAPALDPSQLEEHDHR